MRRAPFQLTTLAIAVAVAVVVVAAPASAADWPRWLGPAQDGTSPEAGVFAEARGLRVVWRRPLGAGYSGIAVAGNRVVTQYGDGASDWLIALDAETGNEVWRYRVGPTFEKVAGAHGGPLSMPAVDDARELVCALAPAGALYCVRMADGAAVWRRDLVADLGARRPHFGFGTAPLPVDDLLFVQTGAPRGKSLVAFDRATGEVRWSRGDDPVGYQSPVVATLDGRRQIVSLTERALRGLDPGDGSVLWKADCDVGEGEGWSTPLAFDGTGLLVAGREETAVFRVRAPEENGGGRWSVREAWRSDVLKRNFATPVVHGSHVYGFDVGNLVCAHAGTGRVAWSQGSDAAGLVLVDGHLVLLDAEGSVVVAPASPARYAPRARIGVLGKGGVTYPSFAGGAVYVRDLKHIARVDVEPGQEPPRGTRDPEARREADQSRRNPRSSSAENERRSTRSSIEASRTSPSRACVDSTCQPSSPRE